MTDPDQLLDELQSEHPSCAVCGAPSDTVRENHSFPYGSDEHGNPITTLDAWLEMLIQTGERPNTVGMCWAHADWRKSPSRGWFSPEKGNRAKSPTNWIERRRDEKKQARGALIDALGRECFVCHTEYPDEDMRVRIPDRARHEFGISDRAEWYRFIVSRPALLKLAVLLCMGCEITPTTADPEKRSNRDRVIQAYGGECWKPECTQSDGLMVVRLPGTRAPRWPNGDKYNSAAKCAYLVRTGFPEGWTLSCGHHYRELSGGGGER